MKAVRGFAVADENGISINTVAATERAAVVNWLVVARRYRIENCHPDETIFATFEYERRQDGRVQLVPVSIEAAT